MPYLPVLKHTCNLCLFTTTERNEANDKASREMMADDVSENRASRTKDPGTLLLRPGQIQGHTKSNQCLGSVSLCVQHASAFLWEPFLPFGQCCVLYCYAGNLCGEMVA